MSGQGLDPLLTKDSLNNLFAGTHLQSMGTLATRASQRAGEGRGVVHTHSVLCSRSHHTVGLEALPEPQKELLCALSMQQAGSRECDKVLWQSQKIARDSQHSPQKLFNYPPRYTDIMVINTPDWENGPLSGLSSTHTSATHISYGYSYNRSPRQILNQQRSFNSNICLSIADEAGRTL